MTKVFSSLNYPRPLTTQQILVAEMSGRDWAIYVASVLGCWVVLCGVALWSIGVL